MIHPDGIVQSIIGTLLIQSVYALVLFPIVWEMIKCCRGRYPRLQHGLWILIVLRLLLPPDIANPWSAGHLMRSLIPTAISHSLHTWPYPSITYLDPLTHLKASLSYELTPDVRNPSDEEFSNSSKRQTGQSPTPLKGLVIIICGAYFTIATLLLTRFLSTRRRFWEIAKEGALVNDPAVMAIVQTWCRRLHIRRRLKVKTVDSEGPAYTIGLFRPVVILPRHLINTTGSAPLEPILAHELVHVKRWDDLAVCLQELVRIVYFFHPLVWFVMPRLTWTREAVCDATVLSHSTFSPRTYGRQMLASIRPPTFPKSLPGGLAKFTSAAKGMAFRLNLILKEEHMRSHPFIIYPAILILGFFLLPMAPVVSSDQAGFEITNATLTQYISQCVPCRNPQEVAHIIWGDLVREDFREEDFARLVAATDCDIVEDIGDGQQAYVFYLLSSSRLGVYRPNFHFQKKENKLMLLYKSGNPSTYVSTRPKVNGRYEIEEGWRADILNGITDDRVNLAWGTNLWFWDGTRYLKAYTEYTIKKATDPSLLGTKREWEEDVRALYEVAPRR